LRVQGRVSAFGFLRSGFCVRVSAFGFQMQRAAGSQARPALVRTPTWFHWLLPRDTLWCQRITRSSNEPDARSTWRGGVVRGYGGGKGLRGW